jgi:hypothetical protein
MPFISSQEGRPTEIGAGASAGQTPRSSRRYGRAPVGATQRAGAYGLFTRYHHDLRDPSASKLTRFKDR